MTDINFQDQNEQQSEDQRNVSDTQILNTEEILKEEKEQKKISYLQNLQKQLYQKIIEPNEQGQDQSYKIKQKLSEDVRYKLGQILKEIQKTQLSEAQKILQLSMKELAYNKVLVNTYGYHEYRLIISHFRLGSAFLRLKCFQQTIEHIGESLKRNSDYNDYQQAKLYHSQMLTSMGEAYINIESYEQAIQLLDRSIQIQEKTQTKQSNMNNLRTYKFLSIAMAKINKFIEANKYASLALEKATSLKGKLSIQFTEALHNKAQVLMQSQKIQESIELYSQAIKLINQRFPNRQQQLIQLHSELAEYYLRSNKTNQYLQSLSKKYKVLEDTYGYRDKRCIKQKRHYATTLLKMQKMQQAQNQLEDILQIQGVVFGQISLQVAKTLKLLGSLNISKREWKSAQAYLKRSQKIFHDQGYPNLQKQVKNKLGIVFSSQNSTFK